MSESKDWRCRKRPNRRTGKVIFCVQCNKEFYVQKNYLNRAKYCSYKCYWVSKRNKPNGRKGEKLTEEHKVKLSIAHSGKKCPKITGNKHPNWQGGISRLPYSLDFNEQLKLNVRQRDNFQCRICQMTEEEHIIVIGKNLHVHHIDYNKLNSDINNLVSLCNQCHTRTNYNRKYWEEYFSIKKVEAVNAI